MNKLREKELDERDMANIQITTEGVKKSLSQFKPLAAVCEYIWNGFDASGTCIEVVYNTNELGAIESLEIKDNGKGIDKNTLCDKFTPFFDSQKRNSKNNKIKESRIKGENGVGRLTFFKFATTAIWETSYMEENNCYKYDITVKENDLENYQDTEASLVTGESGTTVKFRGLEDGVLQETKLREYIAKEFCWYIELNSNKNYEIKINGNKLTYDHLIQTKEFLTGDISEGSIPYTMKFVVWKEALSKECSHYYFVDSSNEELFKQTTSLNRKGDKFYHSAYIQCEIFDDFIDRKGDEQEPIEGYNKASKEFKDLIKIADKELRKLRKPVIKKYSDALIDELEKAKAFPNYNETNYFEKLKKNELETLVREMYVIQPKIFIGLNVEQKKTMVRFLDLIMDTAEATSIINILNEVIELDTEEREDLSKLLKDTKMSNIIKTIQLIKDRSKAIEELKELVFNKELKTKEVPHIQQFIERHYWIFGEQYHLVTAAEPKFEEALRKYIHILTGKEEAVTIEHEYKNREMDIFAVRQDVRNDKYANIVVELKRPSIRLGYKELQQVKDYMNVIMSEPRFNGINMEWEFHLVGNKFDTSGHMENELENAKHHGEKSLVFKTTRYKIYVKTWSEVIAEVEMKHKFLTEKLETEKKFLETDGKSADQILEDGSENSAIMNNSNDEYSVVADRKSK